MTVDSILWTHCRWFDSHEPQPLPETFTEVVRATGKPGAECGVCHEALVPADPELLPWRHRRATEPHQAVLMANTFMPRHGAQQNPAGLCEVCGEALWVDLRSEAKEVSVASEPLTLQEFVRGLFSADAPLKFKLQAIGGVLVSLLFTVAILTLAVGSA